MNLEKETTTSTCSARQTSESDETVKNYVVEGGTATNQKGSKVELCLLQLGEKLRKRGIWPIEQTPHLYVVRKAISNYGEKTH